MMQNLIRVSVVSFCHDGNGRYLLGKRSLTTRDEQGRWEPAGGGGVKFGEGVEDAARREILEEVGASVEELEFLGYRDVFREQNGAQTHWIAFDFRAKINPQEARIMEPEKCDEHRWITIEELEQMQANKIHSQFPVFIQKYRNQLSCF